VKPRDDAVLAGRKKFKAARPARSQSVVCDRGLVATRVGITGRAGAQDDALNFPLQQLFDHADAGPLWKDGLGAT